MKEKKKGRRLQETLRCSSPQLLTGANVEFGFLSFRCRLNITFNINYSPKSKADP